LILLAGSLLAPSSVFLDDPWVNPPLSGLAITTLINFAFLVLVVRFVFIWTKDVRVVPLVAITWAIISTAGAVGPDRSWITRFGFLGLALLVVALAARMFGLTFLRWAFLASVLSISVTGMQLVLQIVNRSVTNEWPLRAVSVPSGSFYLIFLDGYGAITDQDPDVFELKDALWRRGFQVVEGAVANYSFTHASMSNSLSLEHRFRPAMPPELMFDVMQGKNEVRRLLEASGREYLHIESGWSGTRCGVSVTRCLDASWFDSFVWRVGQMSALRELAASTIADPLVIGGVRALEMTTAHATSFDSGKDFVFAHVLLPHPPFQLNHSCQIEIRSHVNGRFIRRVDAQQFPGEIDLAYRAQRACLNEKLLALIEAVPANASVVLTADHGTDLRGQLEQPPSLWTDADIRERFSIFHAVRLPAGCRLGKNHDLMNLIRSEVGCVIGSPRARVSPYHEISPHYGSTELDPIVLDPHDLE
jgi:hypothetical protein